jgi:glycosyltransferase involved in cell wall biosynthesis
VKIALIGTRGVPAQHGGFETAVEEIGWRLAASGDDVSVYCRNAGQEITRYRGMTLVNLPAVRKRSLETLSHTALSVAHSTWRKPDAAVLFNAGNAPLLPFLRLRGIPTAVHMDGLEWKRAKWAGFGARYYKAAEAFAARSGAPLIADAQGIADYLKSAYDRDSHLIAYGAPILSTGSDRLPELELGPQSYHLVVARLEPENNVDLIVRGHVESGTTTPLVVVGSVPYESQHVRELTAHASDRVRFVGGIWDQELLDQLYANARSYLHGHSVGGTNPSLLRALGSGAPVTAYDVVFNREVCMDHARFFADEEGVQRALLADDDDVESARVRGLSGQSHVAATYQWDDVAEAYGQLLREIAR